VYGFKPAANPLHHRNGAISALTALQITINGTTLVFNG
jgi:hypothetical protein